MVMLADDQLSRVEILDHSRADKRCCSQLELRVEHSYSLDPTSLHEPTDIEWVETGSWSTSGPYVRRRQDYQLGNLYRPGLSRGLTCGAGYPRVTVTDRSSPGLMAR